MLIDIYSVGLWDHTLSGCGIVLIAKDESGQMRKREFSISLSAACKEAAELQSATVALASILHRYRSHKILLHTASRFVAGVVTRGLQRADCANIIAEFKKWLGFYSSLTVVLDDGGSPHIITAKELARHALKARTNTDSETQEYAGN